MENEQFFGNFELQEKRGWLDKKCRNLIRPWQPRYFVLKNRILEYYHQVSDPYPAMRINFEHFKADLTFKNNRKLPLIIVSFSKNTRKLKLKAHDEKNFLEWIEAINKHLRNTRPPPTINFSTNSKEAHRYD